MSQSFLNNALQLAAESGDPSATDLVFLHYFQAQLAAVQTLQPCATCFESIDVPALQSRAKAIEQRSYVDFQKLHAACNAALGGDVAKLCTECQAGYHTSLLTIFAEKHG